MRQYADMVLIVAQQTWPIPSSPVITSHCGS